MILGILVVKVWILLSNSCLLVYALSCARSTCIAYSLSCTCCWFVKYRGSHSKLLCTCIQMHLLECAHFEGELRLYFANLGFYHNIFCELQIHVLSSNTKKGEIERASHYSLLFCVFVDNTRMNFTVCLSV